MVDLRLHDAGDLAVPFGATPHLSLGSQGVLAQFMHGGMIIVLYLVRQWQIGGIEDPRLTKSVLCRLPFG